MFTSLFEAPSLDLDLVHHLSVFAAADGTEEKRKLTLVNWIGLIILIVQVPLTLFTIPLKLFMALNPAAWFGITVDLVIEGLIIWLGVELFVYVTEEEGLTIV